MMKYKFEKATCTMCGTTLKDAEPAGDILINPKTGELRGYCPQCWSLQPMVEDKPEPETEPES
ncbi:hypothetical protein ES703_08344 [subsurface metagenome]